MDKRESKTNELTRGVMVFAALAVLTVIEYFLGLVEGAAILLILIALVKGGLVLWFFMHILRVFKAEGDH